jgi:hypothetical protein
LFRTRGAHIEQRLEDIHGKVNELVLSRANVREVLVVLENEEEGQEAQYTLSDRTSRQRHQTSGQTTSTDKEDIGPEQGTTQGVQPTLADVLARVEALSASVGEISQQMKPDEMDIIQRVVEATRPSRRQLMILNMINTKVW